MSYPNGFDPENPVCPKCGGAMYDNRQQKADGERSPKSPDFACKDRDSCDHGVWAERPGGKKGKGRYGKGAPSPAAQRAIEQNTGEAREREALAPAPAYQAPVKHHFTPAEKKIIRDTFVADYFALMAQVKAAMVKVALNPNDAQIPLTMDEVQSATYSAWGMLKSLGALRDPAVVVATARKQAPSANGNGHHAPTPAKPAPVPLPPPVAARAAGGGRPPLIPTGGVKSDDFEEFPNALLTDDDLPF